MGHARNTMDNRPTLYSSPLKYRVVVRGKVRAHDVCLTYTSRTTLLPLDQSHWGNISVQNWISNLKNPTFLFKVLFMKTIFLQEVREQLNNTLKWKLSRQKRISSTSIRIKTKAKWHPLTSKSKSHHLQSRITIFPIKPNFNNRKYQSIHLISTKRNSFQ